ncbi:MAG: haloacid dehalogenase-like hydrolase [Acidobacteria bacterium]|nr:haloacid dehalogenase-like hydrolase [Acidobacteriota bacterium]
MTTPAPKAFAAIVYDFDGTLARGNLPEHSFLPGLNCTPEEFWAEVKREARKHDADEILVYMQQMLRRARAAECSITADTLKQHGRDVPLFAGLDTWFDRISAHAALINLQLEHYVISSGLREMIEGCAIYGQFENVFASKFVYDELGEAVWPGLAVNYTNKTQFLFRINKGVDNSWDNEKVNLWQPHSKRRVPFSRMIFIGDGETDIPSMKMVRHQGGYSIAVFDPKAWADSEGGAQKKLYRLISEDRANFVAPANYTNGSQLDIIIKGILGRFPLD